MLFRRKRAQRKNELRSRIQAILPSEATLGSLDYDGNLLGELAVVVELAGNRHTFRTSRGEIYHNGKLVCGPAYRYIEKEDTHSKLIEMIRACL